jgi:hypothetical protein
MPRDRSWTTRKLRESPEARKRRLERNRAWDKAQTQKALQDPILAAVLREKRRRASLRHKYKVEYGISLEQYEAMFADQKGQCPICLRRSEKTLCVDHCHATRKVRALLCRKCNGMLGFAGDDANVLVRGAIYVVKHGGKPPLRKLLDALNRLASKANSSRSAKSKPRGASARRQKK